MRCWANTLFLVIVLILGTGQMLTACGQKGDLYLPQPKQPVEQPNQDKQPEQNNG